MAIRTSFLRTELQTTATIYANPPMSSQALYSLICYALILLFPTSLHMYDGIVNVLKEWTDLAFNASSLERT